MELIPAEQHFFFQFSKSEEKLKDLWDNIRWNNIHIIGVSEGEEGNGQKNYLKQVRKLGFRRRLGSERYDEYRKECL